MSDANFQQQLKRVQYTPGLPVCVFVCVCLCVFVCVCVRSLCKVITGLERRRSLLSAPSKPQTAVAALCRNGRERERDLEKVNFQQILGKTFLLLLPLSTRFKHHGLPVLSSMPFKSLSSRRRNGMHRQQSHG